MKERLQSILQAYGLNPARLADKMGIQRSGISHIMSGRNKPSYDFLLSLLKLFPELDANWLLTGGGSMYKDQGKERREPASDPSISDNLNLFQEEDSERILNSQTENNTVEPEDYKVYKSKHDGNLPAVEIEQIVLLMSNGKFKSYRKD